MSRQSRTTVRDRKAEENKRDVASSDERYLRHNREDVHNEQDRRSELDHLSGLDRYRLNDLYERSSL